MNAETDPDLPQDPGIPGTKPPEEQYPEEDEGAAPDPTVEGVPDAEQPDVDDEGHMAPPDST